MRKTLEFAAVTARAKLLVDSSTGLKWLGAPPDPDDLRPTTADVGALLASDVEEVLAGTHLVVLGVRLADGTPVETVARRLHDAHPHVGIFVVAARTECAPTRFVVLANAGVDEAYFTDGPGERERFEIDVRRRLAIPPPAEALRAIGQGEAGRDPVAMWLLRNAYRNPSVDDAAAFGRHRASLWRRLRAARLPDPGTLLRCGRVLHAVCLLREMGVDLPTAADRFGMEYGTGVRMMLYRAKRDKALAAAFRQLGLQHPGE